MFKVGEVSTLLEVQSYEVFEKMITHKSLLEDSIIKKDGITYFNDNGLEILRNLFNGNENISMDNCDIETVENDIVDTETLKEDQLDRYVDSLVNEVNNIDENVSLQVKELMDKVKKLEDQIDGFDKELNTKLDRIEELDNKLTHIILSME